MKQMNYTMVASLTHEEFDQKKIPTSELEDSGKFTRSDEADMEKIERLLDVQSGILTREAFFVQRNTCECGRTMTMYDFVFTGLVDAQHDKSFVLHTLIGSKYILNRPRRIRCSACSRLGPEHEYSMIKYSCQVH